MRGDYKSRMEGDAIARQNGWLSANDIRALENMNPIPDEEGGNVYMVNGNMVPITYPVTSQKINELALEMQEKELEIMEQEQDLLKSLDPGPAPNENSEEAGESPDAENGQPV